MHRKTSSFALVVCAAVALAGCKSGPAGSGAGAGASPAAPSGIARFTRHAGFESVKLSPGGTYLAAVTWERGRRALVFMNLEAHTTFTVRPTTVSMVGRFWWVSDQRVVAELVQAQGDLAQPCSSGELYAVDADGRNGRLVFGYRAGEQETGSHLKKGTRTYGWAEVLGAVRGDPDTAVVATALFQAGQEQLKRVVRLDVHSGRQVPVTTSPIQEARFIVDARGEPRVAMGTTSSDEQRVYYRDPESSTDRGWKPLGEILPVSEHVAVLGFWAAAHTLYLVDPNGDGTEGLFAVDANTGTKKLLASNATVAPSRLVTDPETGEAVAVEYEPDLPGYEILNPAHPIARLLSSLLSAFPDEHVVLTSLTDDRKKALVFVYSDRDPGQYLVVDTAAMSAKPVAAVRDWIRPEEMAGEGAFQFTASDGVVVHGYLTLPRSFTPGAPVPLVVVPHGGPHGVRDSWGFDPEAQLLASNGMAVLHVNYRGSSGYGQAFEEAGYRHWGDRVQHDIIEATRFVVDKGFADPRRVCIYGASFGGYSAMRSAALAPDLFRCAVGYAGIYDLRLLASSDELVANHRAQSYLKRVLGEDEAALAAESPVRHADQLTVPVLLIHGAQDQRAPIEHAEALRAELERRGHHVEWLVEPLEGHGFYDEGARERMYARLLAFLRDNLGVR